MFVISDIFLISVLCLQFFLDLVDPEISIFYIILKLFDSFHNCFTIPCEGFDLSVENKKICILKHILSWNIFRNDVHDEPDCFSHSLLHSIQKIKFWDPALLYTLNGIWKNSAVHIPCKNKLHMELWDCNSFSVSTIWSSVCSKSHDGGGAVMPHSAPFSNTVTSSPSILVYIYRIKALQLCFCFQNQ